MTATAGQEPKPSRALIRAEDMPLARRIGAFAFLLFGYFFYAWSWNTVDILRPYIKDSLGLSLEQAGSLYSVQALGALIGAVVNGQLADRLGRRNALFVVMVCYGLALAAGAIVTSLEQVLAQRFILGYFAGSMFPITVGIYSGLFDVRVRARVAGIVLFTYNMAVSAQGVASRVIFENGADWKLLLLAGLVPAAFAILAFVFIPDDRHMTPYGLSGETAPGTPSKLPVLELFRPGVRRQTLLLVAMTGLNFFAYQAFSGWATTYLRDERGFSGADIGSAVGWQFLGAALGGFFWGWVGDRFGRRFAALGFVLAAVLVLVYLFAPLTVTTLEIVAFCYGLVLSSSVVWGPWLAELYPSHLRSTAASIFNWGRIISFIAPIVTAWLAHSVGLQGVMAIATPCFLVAALIWFSLPETLRKSPR